MTERRTSRNSLRRGRMREGIRRVKTWSEEEKARMEFTDGRPTLPQAQTSACGFPARSKEMQVQPVSSSLVMAAQ